MSYTIAMSAGLGKGKTGLAATLRAQLIDMAGTSVGAAQSGFIERGTSGNYLVLLTIPAAHVGGCDVYDTGAPSEILACPAINPQEGENADVKSSAVKLASDGVDAIAVEAGLNLRQAMSIVVAGEAGVLDGATTTTVHIAAAGVPATNRITATVTSDGNRTAVAISPPA